MATLPRFETDVNFISKLDDEPNDVGGLTSAELKAKFDEAGNAIKDYLNNVFVPAVEKITLPGSGDMQTATYDPDGKKTNVFKYADDAAVAATKGFMTETQVNSAINAAIGAALTQSY